MITEDLIVYIQSQLRKNVSRDAIAARLASVGWHFSDIEEGLNKVIPPVKKIEKVEILKPVTPTVVTKPLSSIPTINYEKKVEPTKAVFAKSFSEANNVKNSNIEAQALEISAPITPAVANKAPTTTPPVKKEELIPTLVPKFVVPQPPVINTPPVIERKVESNPVFSALPNKIEEPKLNTKIENPVPGKQYEDHIPNGAMLESYRTAILSVTSENEIIKSKKKFNFNLKWLIPIFILLIIGGVVFAFKQGYIKIPDINLPFIKKDPKTLLLLAPIELGELKSYKTETNVSLSFPPLWGVASGLLAGEAIVTDEEESIMLTSTGIVSNGGGESPDFDYDTVVNSSLLNNKLEINLKHKDSKSILTTPDLTELFGPNSPSVSTIIVPKGEFDSFLSFLPADLGQAFDQLDIDKIFAIGMPSYINEETGSIFREFINSSSVIEKPEEEVRGVATYHYQFNFDAETSRKFINNFIDVFFAPDIDDEKKNLIRDRLSALSLDSLEVWIGKDDSKIHQYSFSVRSPLSRLINLEDKGIAGSIVKLDWKTTYYDFDVPNDVPDSPDAISMQVFLDKIKDMKTKDELMKFQSVASEFKNYAGNFGMKANTTGSCTNPVAGSLFSPIGHPVKATTQVGGMASKMNGLLASHPALACFSTSTDWSLSSPLPSDSTLYFCIDSTGKEKVTSTPIIKSSCE